MKTIVLLIALLCSLNPGIAFGDQERVVSILQELIRADTTNPPGNESRAVDVLEFWLSKAPNITLERLESAPGRTNLIARLKGRGQAPPFILLAHIDVVEANPEEWSVPPFAAIIENGFLWGRGAIDMKGMVAMQVEALLQLAALPTPPAGDIVFLGLADEEAGGALGIEWILKQRPELTRAQGVLNEGSIGVSREHFDIFPIQVAEKGVCWLKVEATGKSGHGSMPNKDNAVLKLSRAMSTLGDYSFPIVATPIMADFLTAISSQYSFPEAFVLRNLFTPIIGDILQAIARPQLSQDRAVFAMLTNTVAPTRLEAGSKINVIPDQALGFIDARILPGFTPEGFRDELQKIAGDDVKLTIVTRSMPNESPRDTKLYQVITEVLTKHYPQAVIAPVMSTGATDSRFFRASGIPAYGIIPVLIPESDLSGLHGKNERIPVAGLTTGVAIIKDIIQGVL